MAKFIQVLLEDSNKTLWAVSVPDTVPVDSGNLICDPVEVFPNGSVIVAVEVGAGHTNESGEAEYGQMGELHLPPDEGGGTEEFPIKAPRFGYFRVDSYTKDGRPILNPWTFLGRITT